MQPAYAELNGSPQPTALPDKLFYKIGEVSRLAGIEPYVLRYWETEFQFLKPRKSKSGQRVYVRKDLEQVLIIKELLYNERLTIEGVRRRLSEPLTARGGNPKSFEPAVSEAGKPLSAEKPVEFVKRRLRDILKGM